MFPRKSLGMFKQMHTLNTCPLYQFQTDGVMRATSIDTISRNTRINQELKYPVAIFQPDMRAKNAAQLLRIIAESYAQIRKRHGNVFVLTTHPDMEKSLRAKDLSEEIINSPFPIYFLRQGAIADLMTMGILIPGQRHLFVLTPTGKILKEKKCAMDEALVSDATDLIRWTGNHGSHAPDANEVLFYRKRS